MTATASEKWQTICLFSRAAPGSTETGIQTAGKIGKTGQFQTGEEFHFPGGQFHADLATGCGQGKTGLLPKLIVSDQATD
jgi:hypothetical protein